MVIVIHTKPIVFVYIDAEVTWSFITKVMDIEVVFIYSEPPVSLFYDFFFVGFD